MSRLSERKQLLAERVLRELDVSSNGNEESNIARLMRLALRTKDIQTKIRILRRLSRELLATGALQPKTPGSWGVHRVAPGTKQADWPKVGGVPDYVVGPVG